MPSSTVEDYLKTLYAEQQRGHGGLVAMGAVAAAMGVTPGTATAMVKALAESGLVEYEPRDGVRLNPKGEKLALHVLRRHRLVELFLVEVLRLDWSEVDQEAEELEHAVSEKVLAKMDDLLGHPEIDPDGDPIPTARGKVRHRAMLSLAECGLDRPFRVARVIDQSPRFLHFVGRSNLKPGTELVVRGRDEASDSVSISIHPHGGATLMLGTAAAAKILVEAG